MKLIILSLIILASLNSQASETPQNKAQQRIYQVSRILEAETETPEWDSCEICTVPELVKRFKLTETCKVLGVKP